MKYLILNHESAIMHISDTIDYQSNGNPLIYDGNLAIAASLVKEVVEIDDSVITLPEDIAPYAYSYIDGEVVPTPDYVEPTAPMDTQAEIKKLQDSVTSLEEQVTDTQLAITELYESQL